MTLEHGGFAAPLLPGWSLRSLRFSDSSGAATLPLWLTKIRDSGRWCQAARGASGPVLANGCGHGGRCCEGSGPCCCSRRGAGGDRAAQARLGPQTNLLPGATQPLGGTQVGALPAAAPTPTRQLGLCRAFTGLCVPTQNILGLHGIPRQFFLQVYETLRRIGETRSAPSLCRPCFSPLPLRGIGLCCFAPHVFGHTLDQFLGPCPAL